MLICGLVALALLLNTIRLALLPVPAEIEIERPYFIGMNLGYSAPFIIGALLFLRAYRKSGT